MIREDEVFYIGYISKARGIRGEVELLFTDDAFDRGAAEYIVLDMDGIFVPFFWEEYRFKNNDTAIFKIEDVNTEPEARRLVGRRVYYPLSALPAAADDGKLDSWKAFTGFNVVNEKGESIGRVDSVDDSSQNILLYLTAPDGREVIIPLHEDFVVECSAAKRTLCLDLPEGLLNVNS